MFNIIIKLLIIKQLKKSKFNKILFVIIKIC